MANGALTGWKQIADHLGTSVRTAQRYEQDLGLPVHRLPAPASGVLAHADELDAWRAEVMGSAERRAAMERAEHEAQGERERDPVAETGHDTAPPVELTEAAPAVAARPRRRLPALLLAATAAVAVATAIGLWAWLAPSAPSGKPHAGVPPSTAAQEPPATAAVLDPGPWPKIGRAHV